MHLVFKEFSDKNVNKFDSPRKEITRAKANFIDLRKINRFLLKNVFEDERMR